MAFGPDKGGVPELQREGEEGTGSERVTGRLQSPSVSPRDPSPLSRRSEEREPPLPWWREVRL